jgi:hypothetical protein
VGDGVDDAAYREVIVGLLGRYARRTASVITHDPQGFQRPERCRREPKDGAPTTLQVAFVLSLALVVAVALGVIYGERWVGTLLALS